MGMPDGWFSVKESSSPFYLLGQLITAVAPAGLDVVADLRDIVSDLGHGKFTIGTALNMLGLVPILGSVDDVTDLRKITQNWVDAFPSKADEVTKFLSDTIIEYLPEWAGVKLLGAISDAPIQKLSDKGVSVEDIRYYSDESVDLQRVADLRSKGVPASDIRKYVDEDVNLKRIEELRNSGYPPQAIKYVVAKGLDPKQFNKLRSQDIPVRYILRYYDEGANMEQVSKLRSQGIHPVSIEQYLKQGADLKQASKLRTQGVSPKDIRHYVANGADLKQVNKLRSKNIPDKDIKYYANNGMSLGGINKLQKMGIPPKDIRLATEILAPKLKSANGMDKYKTISEREVTRLNIKIGGEYRWSQTGLEILKAIVNHDSWEKSRENTKPA
ncbi:hypothetical protein ACFQJ8_04365 [Halocatena marina]